MQYLSIPRTPSTVIDRLGKTTSISILICGNVKPGVFFLSNAGDETENAWPISRISCDDAKPARTYVHNGPCPDDFCLPQNISQWASANRRLGKALEWK